MKKFLTTLALIIGLGLAVWVGAILFIGIAVLAVVGYGIYFVRSFLTQKGILNPTPGVPYESPEEITIIDGDFTLVDEEKVQ